MENSKDLMPPMAIPPPAGNARVFPMDRAACLEWLTSDPDRLTRLNHIRERAGVEPYTIEGAVSMMSFAGGCRESDFRRLEDRIG